MNSRRASALGSYLLGLCIVAGLIALSVPGFARQRHDVRRELCVRTLATIEVAKIYYASDNDLDPGTPVTLEQLAAHGKIFDAKQIPVLPTGAGDFKIGAIGTQPSCEFAGEVIVPMPQLLTTQPSAAN